MDPSIPWKVLLEFLVSLGYPPYLTPQLQLLSGIGGGQGSRHYPSTLRTWGKSLHCVGTLCAPLHNKRIETEDLEGLDSFNVQGLHLSKPVASTSWGLGQVRREFCIPGPRVGGAGTRGCSGPSSVSGADGQG